MPCLLLLFASTPSSPLQTLASDRRSVIDGIGFFADRGSEAIAYRAAAPGAPAGSKTTTDTSDYAAALDYRLAREALGGGGSGRGLDLEAAGDHMAHAADLDRELFGPSHPEYATTLNTLATVCRWVLLPECQGAMPRTLLRLSLAIVTTVPFL